MTARPTPWVGDEVHDQDTDCRAIVTDVCDGTYILRSPNSPAQWTSDRPERLSLTVPRAQRP